MFKMYLIFVLIDFIILIAFTFFVDHKPFDMKIKEFAKKLLIRGVVSAFIIYLLGSILDILDYPEAIPLVYSCIAMATVEMIAITVFYIITCMVYYKFKKAGKDPGDITLDMMKLKFFAPIFFYQEDGQTAKKEAASFWQKLKIIILPITGLMYALFVFGVLEPYFGNLTEWRFGLWDILIPTIVVGVSATVLLALSALVISKNIAEKMAVYLTVFSVMAYIQCNFLNTNNFLDGIFRLPDAASTVGNFLIWLSAIYAVTLLLKFKKKITVKTAGFVSLAVLVIQLSPMPYMFISSADTVKTTNEYSGYTLDGTDQFEVSSKENVIVFIMDTYYSGYFSQLIEEEPEYYDKLSDFIFFDNVGTKACSTAFSMPSILTANDVDFNIGLIESNKKSWNSSSANYFYDSMHKNGYDVRLYTDADIYSGDASNMLRKIDNVTEYKAKVSVQRIPTYFSMLKLSMYRNLPVALKQYFYVSDALEVNRFSVSSYFRDSMNTDIWQEATEASKSNGISYLNYDYYDGLTSGLSPTDKKLCIFQHLHGMHEPYTVD